MPETPWNRMTPEEQELENQRTKQEMDEGKRDGSVHIQYEPGYVPKGGFIKVDPELRRKRLERERYERLLNGPPLSPLIQ